MKPALRPLLCLLAVLHSGCSVGPELIRFNYLRYNTAVADTENEQFLLNLVRLRYRDPPKTLGLSQVTNQFTVDKFAQSQIALPGFFASSIAKITSPLTSSTTTFGPIQARATDVPTVTMIPQTGADFTKGLVTPIPLDRIIVLANSGWDIDRLLRVLVRNLNDVENVPHVAGGGAERPPQFREFKVVAEVLGELQHRGLVIAVIDPEPVPFANLSERYEVKRPTDRPAKEKEANAELGLAANIGGIELVAKLGVPHLPQEQKAPEARGNDADCKASEIEIKASDLISAADKHYRFETVREDKCKVVLKSTMEVYDLILRPHAFEDCGWLTLATHLRLGGGKPLRDKLGGDTGMRAFRLMPADKTQLTVNFDTDRDIFVGTRSILASMLFLSKGIEIPAEHFKEGLVAPPPVSDGEPFDWPLVTEGLFHVQVSKHRPKNCFTSVKYRGYWFYIADDDLSSKSTFNLMLEMFNVQVAPGVAASPILTLNASGPITR
jgi:hypothetical protein